MKKLKPLVILLILVVIADFALVFIDDGNKLETVSHDATVVSCDLKGNTGLDTYYIVKYEYTDGDDKISGTDNYYQKKVSKGDKITVTTRETVVSSYAGYLFYGQIAINILVGVVAFTIVLKLFKLRSKPEVDNDEKED